MSDSISKLIQVAENEVGYLEKASNKNLDDKTANAGFANYTKYGAYFSANPAQWCDLFVDWCFCTAFGKEIAKKLLGGFSAYTPTSAQYFKNMNRWYTTPQTGDVIFFKNSVRICHTGIVCSVDGQYVCTIEGNTSGGSAVVSNGGGCFKKKYSLENSRIAGYGRPDYDKYASCCKKSVNLWGIVTANRLNVRCAPSVDAAVVSVLDYKTRVFITSQSGNGWYKINKGYISSKYTEVETMNTQNDNIPNSWAIDAVEWAINNNIIKGDENGNLKLHDNATKEDLLVFLYRNECLNTQP